MCAHFAGKKFSKRHTTIIDAAIPLIKFAEKNSSINKIILGIIKPTRQGTHRIKLLLIKGGIKATVRGGIYVQEIFFYTKTPLTSMDILNNFIQNNFK
jgi:hypothetical protein